jgi:hypothetical protein
LPPFCSIFQPVHGHDRLQGLAAFDHLEALDDVDAIGVRRAVMVHEGLAIDCRHGGPAGIKPGEAFPRNAIEASGASGRAPPARRPHWPASTAPTETGPQGSLIADQRNAHAQFNLGGLWEQRRGGLSKDDREAARL